MRWNRRLAGVLPLALLAVTASTAIAQQAKPAPPTPPPTPQQELEVGKKAILARTGCYLVDYSFVETDPIKAGYVDDHRVYDVNTNKSVKEWIVAETISPTRIRLQHVLFVADMPGKVRLDSLLKHTGEDWEFNAPFLYDYAGNLHWTVRDLKATPNLWTRRVTNLDDGLRYQCAAAWKTDTAYPEWSCKDDAPIPGRETRDMSRKDYNFLERDSRIVVYDQSALEREANTKVQWADGVKTPIVKELGKTWYVRLPDSECSDAQAFTKKHEAFWVLEREVWDGVLTGKGDVRDAPASVQPSRFEALSDLEDKYVEKNLSDPAVRKAATAEILAAIQKFMR